MAYLKGGTVVDGSLYIEGDLKVKGVSEGEEGLKYTYINDLEITGEKQYLSVFENNDGKLNKSVLSQSFNEESATVNLNSENPIYVSLEASKLTMNYKDTFESDSKNSLSAFNADGNKIIETEGVPIATPAYWAFDPAIVLTATYSERNKLYIVPKAEDNKVLVGDTVLLSGVTK